MTLEIGGPEELVAVFDTGERAEQIELLDRLWRVERPGTAELLDAIGAHHPDPGVAKGGPQVPGAPPQPGGEHQEGPYGRMKSSHRTREWYAGSISW